jgi:hypothetical protein
MEKDILKDWKAKCACLSALLCLLLTRERPAVDVKYAKVGTVKKA